MEVSQSELIPVNLQNLRSEVVGGTGVPPGSTDNGASRGMRVHSPKQRLLKLSRKTHPRPGKKLRNGLVLMWEP